MADTRARIANAPDYRIEVDGNIITPTVRPRLMRLSIREQRGDEADELTLTLDDADGQLALPPRGATVTVALGWRDSGVTPRGTYIVDEVEHSGAPDHIDIRARSANMRESLPGKTTRSWDRLTIGEIIDIIAGRHGLTPATASSLAQTAITHIDQTDESDLNFLTRLGRRYDAIATIKSGRLLFAPRGRATSASGIPLPGVTINRQAGDQHHYRATDRDTYTGVVAYWRDHDKGQRQKITAGTDERTKRLRDTYPTPKEARDAALSELVKLQREEHAFDITLARGRADLSPELPATVTGFKAQIDASNWLITEVTHELTDSAYTNRVTLETSAPD